MWPVERTLSLSQPKSCRGSAEWLVSRWLQRVPGDSPRRNRELRSEFSSSNFLSPSPFPIRSKSFGKPSLPTAIFNVPGKSRRGPACVSNDQARPPGNDHLPGESALVAPHGTDELKLSHRSVAPRASHTGKRLVDVADIGGRGPSTSPGSDGVHRRQAIIMYLSRARVRAVSLIFRRWRRPFSAIFCGWLTRGVGAGPLRPGHLPPEASVSRHAAGAGCGSQAPRTQSHRLTHQPHVPLAATHRAPNPAMPRRPHNRLSRQLSRLPTGLSKSHPRQRDFLIVAPFGKRFDYIDSINVI